MEKQLPKLGNIVRDLTTGFEGIAIQTVELMSGSIQLCVQARLDRGQTHTGTADAVPGALNIDVQLLEYVDKGIADRVAPTAADPIQLGNEVEDIVTGLKGIACSRHIFINGCIYYHVLPRQTAKQAEEGKLPESVFTAVQRLKKIGAAIGETVAKNLAKPAAKRPGGPTTKASRA